MVALSQLLPTQFVLYADDGYASHVVRLLLEEKQLEYELLFIDDDRPDELAELNPYRTLPVLANRDVALYEINIIFEYLEERHQMPKLLPHTPKERALARTLAWRLQKDWLTNAYTLLTHPDSFDAQAAANAKKSLSDSLITLSPLFGRQEFFLSDEFGWCDVLILPLLWRLPQMGIVLPAHLCRPLIDYQNRLFKRSSFIKSIALTI
ncbi:glutathione S-transferase N-terminal domain-containing protein [Moraxella sp.]|uniref:glutathione S-transferase N-terminal domain-containing protein n=1 Tax=Moraxella sp. TaxID=479 RepID=UPI0026DD4014|nr:glutathione S-transferase N-terminal domain-containing protein [Moraxella sp.]MDO4895599.1 glutathione S-transferase N-terminal domain-containing protein [Moraxella sp.]